MSAQSRFTFLALFYVAITAFFLNFFWEAVHGAFLYAAHWETLQAYIALIIQATFGDVLYLLLIYAVGAAVFRGTTWIRQWSWKKIFYTVVAGFLLAVFIEYKGVYLLGKWSYADTMPLVFGLGLSPLLQLAATGLLTFYIVGISMRCMRYND